MSVKNRNVLKMLLASTIYTNGNKEINAADHQAMLEDFLDSHYNRTTDIALIGLKEYDSSVTYAQWQCCVKDGIVYQAAVNNVTGTWDVGKWTALTNNASPPPGVTIYDNATTYNTDELVSYQGSIYRARTTTQGNLPTVTAKWELLQYSDSKVVHHTDGHFYWEGQVVILDNLIMQSPSGGIVSTDVDQEIDNEEWIIISWKGGIQYVPADTTLRIPPRCQNITYGNMDMASGGILHIHKNAQQVFPDDGVFTGSGSTVGNGTNYPI